MWFKKKETEPNAGEKFILRPGQKWLMEDKSPWDNDYFPVKILDVKEGWVRYYMSDIFPDNRMEIDRFRRCYCKLYNTIAIGE